MTVAFQGVVWPSATLHLTACATRRYFNYLVEVPLSMLTTVSSPPVKARIPNTRRRWFLVGCRSRLFANPILSPHGCIELDNVEAPHYSGWFRCKGSKTVLKCVIIWSVSHLLTTRMAAKVSPSHPCKCSSTELPLKLPCFLSLFFFSPMEIGSFDFPFQF